MKYLIIILTALIVFFTTKYALPILAYLLFGYQGSATSDRYEFLFWIAFLIIVVSPLLLVLRKKSVSGMMRIIYAFTVVGLVTLDFFHKLPF